MTIQRLYSLPNCRLVLEGLSGNGPTGQGDPRPVLSVLMSAECHFQGKGEPLTGGREFFESLVRAVSSYAQEFLSGVPTPLNHNGQAALVHLRKIHGDLHRLTFEEKTEAAPDAEAKMPLEKNIDLTTVQLFDLVEAVDQFFADPLALPDLSVNLKPVSKREVTSTEPVAKRALPVGIGVSGFALAAIAFFLLPIPEVRRPTEPGLETEAEGSESVEGSPISNPEEPLLEPSPETTEELFSPEVPPAENLEESLGTTSKITEPEKIEELRVELFARIDDSWTEPISSDLSYRVQVAEDGAIVGYKPINPESEELVARTPLPNLLYKPADGRATNEPIAEFKVEFTSDGTLKVNPAINN